MGEWKKYIQENKVVVEVSYPIIRSHGKLFYTVLELHLDHWNGRHITHFGFDNHAFLFFSAFRRATR